MKVVAFNGSARPDGNCTLLLKEVFSRLAQHDIQTELVLLSQKKIKPCIACYKCLENKDRRCAIQDDDLNACIAKMMNVQGIILASPIIIYQFWMFVAPGLYEKERGLLVPIVFLSTFFFVGGALFGYFIVFPFGFKFFLGFATDVIKPFPSMREYLSFSSKLLLAFGLVFELPLIVTFLAKLGIVNVPFLKKNRKYAILLFFVCAAIITPPDVVTQIMMALPLMVLYEISILGARMFGRKVPDIESDSGQESVANE